ncbi:50S ribosomal protein L3, partial [Lachnospiraceae bacterium OttesenSCG-928-E19]|nr:50S ribosomal protein L3 [Lachnospiraceae bacterium OttesenSCG-928-E19]
MTRLYDDNGVAHGVTVLSVGDCSVVGNRTMEKNGYVANVLGMREAKAKHVAKPQQVAAQKAGVKPYRKVVEFRVSDDC